MVMNSPVLRRFCFSNIDKERHFVNLAYFQFAPEKIEGNDKIMSLEKIFGFMLFVKFLGNSRQAIFEYVTYAFSQHQFGLETKLSK